MGHQRVLRPGANRSNLRTTGDTHTPVPCSTTPPLFATPSLPPPPLDNYMPFTHPTTHSSRSSLTRSRPSLDYLSQADLWALGCILFEMLCGHQVTDALPLLPPSAWGYYINSQPSLIEMLCGHQVTERPHTQLCIFFPLSLPVTLSLSLSPSLTHPLLSLSPSLPPSRPFPSASATTKRRSTAASRGEDTNSPDPFGRRCDSIITPYNNNPLLITL